MKYFSLLCLLIILDYSGAYSQTAGSGYKGGGQYINIGKIIIEGNKVTRRAVILREISIHEGDRIMADSIPQITNEIKLRLFNMQLFNEVEQRTAADAAGNLDWYISVKERWYIIPSFSVQYADRNFNTWLVKEHADPRRITGGLTLTDKNFRGSLEQLAITVQAGYSQGLGISYLRPYVNKGQTNGVGFWAHVAQGSQTYYNTDANTLVYAGGYSAPVIWRQAEGGLTYVYRPAYASKHTLRLSYRNYSVSDTVVKLNTDYFTNGSNRARLLELSYRYEFNGVDNWNYSLTGQKIVAVGVLRNGIEGVGFQSFAMVEAGVFRSPAPRWYWSAILRGRLMYPQYQPYFFRSALGTQTEYVRGYEYYIIDGTSYGILRLDLKKEVFNNTYTLPLTYFTAIPLRIYPKVFADAAYVGNPSPGNSTLNNRLLFSLGAGVDIVTLYDIKIRIEFAWNHLWQNGLYLHFNSE